MTDKLHIHHYYIPLPHFQSKYYKIFICTYFDLIVFVCARAYYHNNVVCDVHGFSFSRCLLPEKLTQADSIQYEACIVTNYIYISVDRFVLTYAPVIGIPYILL